MDKETASKVINKLQNTTTTVTAYGTSKPLPLCGEFTTKVCVGDTEVTAKFVVLDGHGKTLLSAFTAEKLNLLRINTVNHVLNKWESLYPQCFSGQVGCLKDFETKLHLNKEINPMVQQPRRLPFTRRKLVKKELDRLQKDGIIEKVQGPSAWVSPIVVVPKANNPDQVRICVDMRLAIKSVQR
jgi:hypothetical protein